MQLKRLALLLFVLTLFSINYGHTQQEIVTVIGKVTDQFNRPIADVHVYSVESRLGQVTDKYGVFKLRMKPLPVNFTCSHIGFFESGISITEEQIFNRKSDTIFVDIAMARRTMKLDAISVNASGIESVFYKPEILLIDYEFWMNRLLLLLKVDKKYRVRMLDFEYNTLAELEFPWELDSFYRNAFGGVHVIAADTVYQLYLKPNDLELLDVTSKDKFEKFVKQCVVATDSLLVFPDLMNHNKDQLYFSVNRNTKQKNILHHIFDEVAAKYAQIYYNKIVSIYCANVPMTMNKIYDGTWDGDVNSLNIPFTRDNFELIIWYNKVVTKPISAPIFESNNEIVLFDHVNDSLFRYDVIGRKIASLPISYHKDKKWTDRIISDFNGNYYAVFEKSGISYLKQIDLKSGEIISVTKIEQHTFPQNLKVRDGYVYYMHTDRHYPYLHKYRTQLYRQKITQPL